MTITPCVIVIFVISIMYFYANSHFCILCKKIYLIVDVL